MKSLKPVKYKNPYFVQIDVKICSSLKETQRLFWKILNSITLLFENVND